LWLWLSFFLFLQLYLQTKSVPSRCWSVWCESEIHLFRVLWLQLWLWLLFDVQWTNTSFLDFGKLVSKNMLMVTFINPAIPCKTNKTGVNVLFCTSISRTILIKKFFLCEWA
jgi:hypothetical protein